MVWRAADGVTGAGTLLERPRPQYPTVNEEPRPLLAADSDEAAARLSPDGRWVAYRSDESGRLEVYVRRFPDVNAGKWNVSTKGGHHPVWWHDGRELYYALGSSMYRVSVDTRGGAFVAGGASHLLFGGPLDLLTEDYALTPAGDFIMVEADPNARPIQIQVVLHWAEEAKRVARR